MPLFEKALEQQARLPASANLVRILSRMSGHMRGEGAYTRAVGSGCNAPSRSAPVCASPSCFVRSCRCGPWTSSSPEIGPSADATTREAAAVDIGTAVPDLVWEGVLRIHMLLHTGGRLEEFRAVAEPALDLIRSEEIESFPASLLQSNFVQALVRAGLVTEAARLIDPMDRRPHLERGPLAAVHRARTAGHAAWCT